MQLSEATMSDAPPRGREAVETADMDAIAAAEPVTDDADDPADEPADDRLSPTEDTRPDHDEMRDRCPPLRIDAGRRKTKSVDLLVTEAELAADGVALGNPATPISEHVGEAFAERIDDTDLVPAWTRPWEVDDDA